MNNKNELFDTSAVILANGTFPENPKVLRILETAPYIVCCDGAVDELLRHGFTPDAIVGDGDSISEANRLRFAGIFHQIDDQETNDLTKAVRFLTDQGKNRFTILGATGAREDHTLGNISLLIDYMRSGIQVEMCTDYGKFTPLNGCQTFVSYPGQQVSIFNFGTQQMEACGLKYPIRDFTNWWQGTLNEAMGNEVTIRTEGNYLIFRAY